MSCSDKQQSSSKMNNLTTESSHSDTSFVEMEKIIQEGKKVVKEVSGKDLVILLGGAGAGKSVLFNYLSNIPMKEYSTREKGIEGDFVIDIVGSNSNAAPIGHSNDPMTLIPQITSLDDDLLCCDCPGFLDNQENVEIRVANAVNIQNILHAARQVKIILLLEYSSFFNNRQKSVKMIGEIAQNLFRLENGLVQHANSILLGITKIPTGVEKKPFNDLKGIIQRSAGLVIRHLSDNLLIFDPLDRDDLKYDRAWNQRQLIEKIKILSSIAKPIEVFHASLSSDEYLAVQKVCQELDAEIQQFISEDELMKAANHFQKLKSLKVLEHEVVDKAMNETRKNVKNRVNEIIIQIEKLTNEENLKEAEEKKIDLKKLVETFENKDGEEELKRLELKYKDTKWWCDLKFSAKVAGGVALVGTCAAGFAFGVVAATVAAVAGGAAALGAAIDAADASVGD